MWQLIQKRSICHTGGCGFPYLQQMASPQWPELSCLHPNSAKAGDILLWLQQPTVMFPMPSDANIHTPKCGQEEKVDQCKPLMESAGGEVLFWNVIATVQKPISDKISKVKWHEKCDYSTIHCIQRNKLQHTSILTKPSEKQAGICFCWNCYKYSPETQPCIGHWWWVSSTPFSENFVTVFFSFANI